MRYKFTLQRRKKDGVLITKNMPIRIDVTHSGERLTLSTGYNCDLKSWDSSKQEVKQGHTTGGFTASRINNKLGQQKSVLSDFKDSAEFYGRCDLSNLKTIFAKEFPRKHRATKIRFNEESFFECFDRFTDERGKLNSWTKATYTKFASVRNHLEKFDKDLTFETLTDRKLTKYMKFLCEDEKLINSTIKKQLGFLNWFLNYATEKGYNKNIAYQSFKPKLKTAKKKVVYLTSAELDLIRNYEIPEKKQYLERVRDVFLFTCYTGLRHSDVFNLKRHDRIIDKINITSIKDVDLLSIKLNQKALDIILKYKGANFENHKALPVISNQRMNDYLQDLCELAKINKKITQVHFKLNERIEVTLPKCEIVGTHTGRRTFICNALIKGMPASAVMKITGHADLKAMQPYIDTVSEEVDNMMENLDF